MDVEHLVDVDGYRGGESVQQPLLVDGVQVAHIGVGASRWALSAYVHPRFDGVIVRMLTLIGEPGHRLGSSSGCTDYFDGYRAVPRARIEAARNIARARSAATPGDALAWALKATEADPTWSGATDELRRRERRAKRR